MSPQKKFLNFSLMHPPRRAQTELCDTVPGIVEPAFTNDLGYTGAKIVEGDNSTKITIMAAPETIVINYLKKVDQT